MYYCEYVHFIIYCHNGYKTVNTNVVFASYINTSKPFPKYLEFRLTSRLSVFIELPGKIIPSNDTEISQKIQLHV